MNTGYEHLDDQGIVSLISGYYEKQTDEYVEDDNDDQHTPKCPFTHSEAMQKIDDLKLIIGVSQKPRQKKFHNLLNSVSVLFEKNLKLNYT